MTLAPLPRGPWRITKDGLHTLQHRLARVYGRPGSGMLTDVQLGGRPVIFLHNPKAGGTSLGRFLGVKRRSHAFPTDRINPRYWTHCFVIVAVRDPFDRFLSGYFDHVGKDNFNALTRIYGPAFKRISPFEYLEILLLRPKFGGSQLLWTDYPHPLKPRADLVLRYEEIQQWPGQLAAAGLELGDRSLPHSNKGPRSEVDPRLALGLTVPEFARLEQAVRVAFWVDALAFGYPLPVADGASTDAGR